LPPACLSPVLAPLLAIAVESLVVSVAEAGSLAMVVVAGAGGVLLLRKLRRRSRPNPADEPDAI
jgi:hypothetical protein